MKLCGSGCQKGMVSPLPAERVTGDGSARRHWVCLVSWPSCPALPYCQHSWVFGVSSVVVLVQAEELRIDVAQIQYTFP